MMSSEGAEVELHVQMKPRGSLTARTPPTLSSKTNPHRTAGKNKGGEEEEHRKL